MKTVRLGEFLVIVAYASFGLLPLFWNLLHAIAPEQILFHRAFWSAAGLGIVLGCQGRLRTTLRAALNLKQVAPVILSAALLGSNWFTYLIALKEGHLAEASLGYFICPLMSMSLGVLFCGERMNRGQASGVFIMLAGVLTRILMLGTIPWIALALAVSFSTYQLIRKQMGLAAQEGFFLECCLLAALSFPIGVHACGSASALFSAPGFLYSALLILTGVVTAVPMICLIAGARQVSMRFLGISQYVSPTLSLLIAVTVYGEKFRFMDAAVFALIWLGIGLYFAEGFLRRKAPAQAGAQRDPGHTAPLGNDVSLTAKAISMKKKFVALLIVDLCGTGCKSEEERLAAEPWEAAKEIGAAQHEVVARASFSR